jgi:hypothetical protein
MHAGQISQARGGGAGFGSWPARRWARRQSGGWSSQWSARTAPLFAVAGAAVIALALVTPRAAAQAKSGSDAVSKAVGTIKTVQSGSITVAAESGGDVSATLAPTTRILRVPPGEKDLKNATALQASDLQPGDRVLVRGPLAADGHTIAALAVIVMKQSDVSAAHQRESEDWQKRGTGGLVTSVDATTGTITISSGGVGASHNIAVHVVKSTILRRYAPGSVKFDDAKPAALSEIRVGDQLRARGNRNADGSELAADEVVSGSFRNIAGTITAIDAASNTITVHDLIAKAAVVVKISPESQMKKLTPEMAQHIAARLKSGGDQPASANSAAGSPASGAPAAGSSAAGSTPSGSAAGSAGAQGRGGPPDVQRMLSRLPNSSLADLAKGEVVMIVSTGDNSGAASGEKSSATSAEQSSAQPPEVTAITLLAGVEPILTAAPARSASLLSPWSLNTSGGEGDSAP